MTTTTIREHVSRLAGLLAREREALVEFIAELADFDRRRSWEELGYPTLFEFLTRELRLSMGRAPTASAVLPDTNVPMTAQLSRIHLTVTRELLAKLETARLALSHVRPDATLADILELGADTAIAQDAKRKGLVRNPRPARVEAPPASSESSHIPAHIRRAVWERDQGCCQWKVAGGGICGSRYRLQFDHIQPRAMGGATTTANVRLLCQAHNLLVARMAYGEKLMRAYRRGVVGPRIMPSPRQAAGAKDSLLTEREPRTGAGPPVS